MSFLLGLLSQSDCSLTRSNIAAPARSTSLVRETSPSSRSSQVQCPSTKAAEISSYIPEVSGLRNRKHESRTTSGSMDNDASQQDLQAILGAKSLPEYLEKTSQVRTNSTVLAFPIAHAEFRYYGCQDISHGSKLAAKHYIGMGLPSRVNDQPSVIAISARGSIEWVFTFWALIRLGHTVLVLSPRLPAASVNALMSKCGSKHLICGSIPAGPDSIASSILPIILKDEVKRISVVDTDFTVRIPKDPSTATAFYLHSSGSTGLPKLIPSTHTAVLDLIKGWNSFLDDMTSFAASAVYNGIGLYSLLACMIRSKITYYENDSLEFTAKGYAQFLEEAKPEKILITPYSLALVASTDEGMKALRQANRVSSLGSVCPTALGDGLVAEGVRLANSYGQQEVGPLLTSALRPADDHDWEYLEPLPAFKDHVGFLPTSEQLQDTNESRQLYELVVLRTFPGLDKRWVNSDNPPGSFHSGDLFLKHATKDNRWKVIGRKDDQMRIYADDRGSTVNATYYESRIKDHVSDIVDEVVLFGQGRRKLGLLIFPKEAVSRSVALDRVWAAVMKDVNPVLPTALDKDMLRVIEGEKAPVTNKLNIIRAQVHMNFADVINDAYNGTASL